MAGRKKKTDAAVPPADTTAAAIRAFTVVVEDLRSQFGVFGEALQGLREQTQAQFGVFGEALQGLREGTQAQFRVFGEELRGLRTHMDARFDAHDARFDRIEHRLDAHDARFDRVDRDLSLVKDAVLVNTRAIHDLGDRVSGIETKLDAKVDRAEVEAIVARAAGHT